MGPDPAVRSDHDGPGGPAGSVREFTVARYRDPLRALHERIERDWPFVAHSQRFLIEARKPG
ncbi:hypothetical protein GCM10009682_13900 [Luedemannella flava]|uniref:Uncharacterized protein n=1 Tax=Luedemannella flava TaxID=349316 RepID=A0ABN2LMU9_9ACTN